MIGSYSESRAAWPETTLFCGSAALSASIGLLIATGSITLLLPILAAGAGVLVGTTGVIVHVVAAPARYLLFVTVFGASAGVFVLNLGGLEGMVAMFVLVADAAAVSRTPATVASLVFLLAAVAALKFLLD